MRLKSVILAVLERAATASPSLKRTLDRLAHEKNVGANQ